jgi:hypothetical protein
MVWVDDLDFDGTDFGDMPAITWQQSGEAEQLLWKTNNSDELSLADSDADLSWSKVIQLGGNTWDDVFSYIPDAGGDWIYGRIKTQNIRTAALGVWMGPDWTLTDDEAQILMGQVAPGKVIRGYTTTEERYSIGNLIHRTGTGTATDDDLLMNTWRCLFGYSYPRGIHTAGAAYTHLGRDDTTYQITRQRHNTDYESTNYEADVAIVVHTDNCSAGNEAYVKISSITAGDSIEFEIDSDTAVYDPDTFGDMYTQDSAEASQAFLELASAGDTITIESKATGTSEIHVEAVYLWERDFTA